MRKIHNIFLKIISLTSSVHLFMDFAWVPVAASPLLLRQRKQLYNCKMHFINSILLLIPPEWRGEEREVERAAMQHFIFSWA